MTINEWAKTVAEILGYLYNSEFCYFLDDTYEPDVVFCFQCVNNGIYTFKCSYNIYPNVIDASMYMSYWFKGLFNV